MRAISNGSGGTGVSGAFPEDWLHTLADLVCNLGRGSRDTVPALKLTGISATDLDRLGRTRTSVLGKGLAVKLLRR